MTDGWGVGAAIASPAGNHAGRHLTPCWPAPAATAKQALKPLQRQGQGRACGGPQHLGLPGISPASRAREASTPAARAVCIKVPKVAGSCRLIERQHEADWAPQRRIGQGRLSTNPVRDGPWWRRAAQHRLGHGAKGRHRAPGRMPLQPGRGGQHLFLGAQAKADDSSSRWVPSSSSGPAHAALRFLQARIRPPADGRGCDQRSEVLMATNTMVDSSRTKIRLYQVNALDRGHFLLSGPSLLKILSPTSFLHHEMSSMVILIEGVGGGGFRGICPIFPATHRTHWLT